MLIEGVFVKEARLCIDKLEADDDAPSFGRSTFQEYTSMFATPKAYPSGAAVFDQNTPGGSASEWLSACPVIRKLCTDVLLPNAPSCAGAIQSLIYCCDVVLDFAASTKTTPERLSEIIERYLVAHLAEYGLSAYIPKHHYILHLPDEMRKWFFFDQHIRARTQPSDSNAVC